MNKIKDLLYSNRLFLIIFTMLGLLGSIDVVDRNLQDGGNLLFLSIQWFTISFLFSMILSIVVSIKNKIIKWVGLVVSALYALLCVTNAVSYLFWGFGISSRMFTILYETNSREACEFIDYSISNFISSVFLIRFLVFALVTTGLVFGFRKLKEKPFAIIIAILGCLGAIFSVIQFLDVTEKKNVNIFIRSFLDFSRTRTAMHRIGDMEQLGGNENYLLETLQGESDIDNIVIVIGESAARSHHSIYGYNLKTSPLLESKKDVLIAFNDVISSYSTTSESMKMFMTYKNSTSNTQDWYHYPAIPTVYSKLGYKTYWISNQEKGGFFSGCENYFSDRCDTSLFVGMLYSGDNLQEKFDDVILPKLSEVMDEESSKKLVFLHLMGSHGDYKRRYPKQFAQFSDKDIVEAGRDYLNKTKKTLISEYDNSILYTDFILSNMIDTLRKQVNKKSLFIYFSDHGEEMYEKRDFAGHSNGYVDIPFVIWTSDSLRSSLGDKYTQMTQSVDKPIAIENLFDFLLGLSDIKYHYYNPSLDFLSPDYHLEKRFADDVEYHKGQCD